LGQHNDKTDTLCMLKDIVWNIDLSGIDSMKMYQDSPMFFSDKCMYFYNKNVGGYEVKEDSIFVNEIYYNSTKEGLKKVVKEKLVGVIKEINNDSLVIEKLKGKGFYFVSDGHYKYYPTFTTLRFYNDKFNLSKKFEFDKISLSSSGCYGNCAIRAIEIKSNGDCKYYGGKNANMKGYYVGRISKEKIDSLKFKMNAALVNYWNLNNTPLIDAQVADLIVCYNKLDTLKILGSPVDFPIRLKELFKEIMDINEKAELKPINAKLDFITKQHDIPPVPIEQKIRN